MYISKHVSKLLMVSYLRIYTLTIQFLIHKYEKSETYV